MSKQALKATTVDQSGKAVVKIDGPIMSEANVVLAESAEKVKAPVVVIDLAKLTFINSVGVLCWISFLRLLGQRQIFLENCPEMFLELAEMCPDLYGTTEVQSFFVEYECICCDFKKAVLYRTVDMKNKTLFPTVDCPTCSKALEAFNDVDFYQFLSSGAA